VAVDPRALVSRSDLCNGSWEDGLLLAIETWRAAVVQRIPGWSAQFLPRISMDSKWQVFGTLECS